MNFFLKILQKDLENFFKSNVINWIHYFKDFKRGILIFCSHNKFVEPILYTHFLNDRSISFCERLSYFNNLSIVLNNIIYCQTNWIRFKNIKNSIESSKK